ncbi:Mlp family lipoprotein [Borreliella bavariensis]|uniref:Mlp family lipoprotein n=2 Tax=Borreliella bavariensis TaxID=664662 RepID=UPI001CB71996|nr:Mlp family lipoprotein [Borreliella bavariensis]
MKPALPNIASVTEEQIYNEFLRLGMEQLIAQDLSKRYYHNELTYRDLENLEKQFGIKFENLVFKIDTVEKNLQKDISNLDVKIDTVDILFCLFLIMLNGCNSNDNDTVKNNAKQSQSRKKRDLEQKESQEEKPKSRKELLIEKLDEDQKKQLEWLETALTKDGEFDTFLQHDEDKIKKALEHIKTQLDKCNGNNEGKNTFKQVVQGALNNGTDIDNFENNAASTCGN